MQDLFTIQTWSLSARRKRKKQGNWLAIRSWWNLGRASSCPPPSSGLSGEIPGAWTRFPAGGAAWNPGGQTAVIEQSGGGSEIKWNPRSRPVNSFLCTYKTWKPQKLNFRIKMYQNESKKGNISKWGVNINYIYTIYKYWAFLETFIFILLNVETHKTLRNTQKVEQRKNIADCHWPDK